MAIDEEANGWVGLTAVFVDGPRDGTTEAFALRRWIVAGWDRDRTFVYLLWPEGASGPTGEYVGDTIQDGTVRILWRAFSPEESDRRARVDAPPERSIVPGCFEIRDSWRAVPMVRSGDPSAELGRITAVYVGGPKARRSEELEVRVRPNDEPGVVRVTGFDVWPVTPHPSRQGDMSPTRPAAARWSHSSGANSHQTNGRSARRRLDIARRNRSTDCRRTPRRWRLKARRRLRNALGAEISAGRVLRVCGSRGFHRSASSIGSRH
jgi:hypothetical protein